MRLITRFDFDGITCAVLISEVETIHEINFANPKDIEDRMVEIDVGDVVAHLPFHPDARVWFHHHDTGQVPQIMLDKVRGKHEKAPSAAHLVFEFYGPERLSKYQELVSEADRIGSANLTQEDIMSPRDWILVSYTLDPRFEQDYSYAMLIIDAIKQGRSAADILSIPEVARRVEIYKADEARFEQESKRCTTLLDNVILTDFRQVDRPPHGNRFRVFTEYPEGNVHLRVDKLDMLVGKVSVSKSIFNRTCQAHIGRLMEEFGGGGMEGAGTCRIGMRYADTRIAEIVERLK